jgi:pre-rRNA-processing protein TSR1
VTLVIKEYPPAVLNHSQTIPLIVSSLLPYERKMSVCHFHLTRVGDTASPLPSKGNVTIQAGFRRIDARPIYSEHTPNCDKARYMQFLNDSGVASIYHPAIFPPSNVLVFTGPTLVASGTFLSFDPKRLIIKRILLTGYPVKVHKRKAVIRYMFFDPKDILYFRPIELHTKEGLRGHILESLGTHGHMKCVFNDFMKYSDTVCLPLFKRVFPVQTFEG